MSSLKLIASTVMLAFISLNSTAAIYYSRATGNWNSNSTWSLSSYGGSAASSCPGSGVADVVLISGYTITVTASPTNAVTSLILSQSNNTGNDTKLYMNTLGITLRCNAFSANDNNLSDDIDIEIAQGILQVNGNATFVRSTSNNQNERLKLYIRNTGRVNVTGNFIYTLNRAKNNQSADNEIQLDNNGRLDITGNLTATIGNINGKSNDFEFVMNNTSICNVGGSASFTVSNSDDGDDMAIVLNGGAFSVTGAFTGLVSSSGSSSNSLHLTIDGATMSTGAFTFTQSGGTSGDMDTKLNSNSTSTPAALTVNGSLTYTHNNGDNMEIETNTYSTITITQDLNVLLATSADGDNVYLDFNGGTFNVVNGNITMAGGATSSNFIYFDVDGTTINFSGNLTFTQNGGGGTGDMNFFINSNFTSVATTVTVGGNLIMDHAGGDNYEIELNNNATLTVAGNLIDTLESSDGDDFFIDINGGTFTVGQDFFHIQTTAGSTTEDLNIRIDGSGKLNIGDDVYLDQRVGGQISIYTNYSSGSTTEFNVGGDFTVYHAAAADGIYLETDQSSIFTVGGNFLIDNYASGGDNARIRMNNTSTFTVGGTLTMNMLSGSVSANDFIEVDINGGTMTVGGNMTMYSIAGNDAIVTVDGNSSSLTVNGILKLQHSGGDDSYLTAGNGTGSPTITVGALTLDDSGGDITYCRLYNSSVLNVSGNITLNALAASEIDIGVYSSSSLKIGGNFIRAALPYRFGVISCAATSTVEYNGLLQQTIGGDAGSGGDGFTYGSVTLNNSAGFMMTNAEGNASIPNSAILNFASGIVISASSGFFIIANGASVSGASNISYIDGPIRKVGNSAFTFPIGDNGNYQPASISAPSGSTFHFTAQYFASNPAIPYNSGSLSGVDHVSKCEYWHIDRTNGSTNVTVTLAFDAGSCGVTDLSTLRIARWDGSTWQNQGNGGTTGTTSAGTIINGTTVSSYLTPNSPFTLASSNSSNPLPVEMISFNAKASDNAVTTDWSTASEVNSDYFEVQRLKEGGTFEGVVHLKGAGNSNNINNYKWTDTAPHKGLSYYRLKQVDFNGDFVYTDSRAVNFYSNNTTTALNVYPNPSNGNKLTVSLNNQHIPTANEYRVTIELFDATGKLVFTQLNNSNSESFNLFFNKKLNAGIYILKMIENDLAYNQLVFVNQDM